MKERVGKIAVFLIATLAVIGIISALSGSKPEQTSNKQTMSTKDVASTKAAQSSFKPSATSTAMLNAQIKPIFSNVTNTYIQLYNQGVTDSSSATMQNYTTFNTYDMSFVSSKPVPSLTASLTAVNQANSLYKKSGLKPAPILKQWYNDNTDVWEDISQWATDEDIVLGEEVSGSAPSSSQTNTLAKDLQMYNQDMDSTQKDLTQL